MDVQKHFKKTKGASALYGVFAALMVLFSTLAVTTPAMAYHFPWDQGHDTFDWNDPNDPGPCEGPECDPCKSTGSPVYIPTGHFVWSEQDIQLPGRPGLSISRSYNSNDPRLGIFGNGWSSNCDSIAVKTVDWESGTEGNTLSSTTYLLREPNGKRYSYTLGEAGDVESPTGRDDQVELLSEGRIKLTTLAGSYRIYSASGQLLEDAAPSGSAVSYDYDDQDRLVRMAASSGQFLELAYNGQGFVSTITDNAGRQWQYSYDVDGNLVQVIDASGGAWNYTYQAYSPPADAQTYYQLTGITDPVGRVITDVSYDGTRVTSYTSGANTYSYSYNTSQRRVTKTDSAGSQWTFLYNEAGQNTQLTGPDGSVEQYEYDADGNFVKFVDAANNEWTSTYDAEGRRLTFSDPTGATSQWQYETDFPYPTEAISPTGAVTTASYDAQGNITSVTDPSGALTQFEWSADGYIESIRNALTQQTTFTTNSAGLPTAVTQPDGRTGQIIYDDAGKIVGLQDNVGNVMSIERDPMGRTLRVTEPSGEVTSFTRNAAGDVITLTNPKGQTLTYEYDQFGRVTAEVFNDGGRREYDYRSDNLLVSITEKDGSVTSYSYDSAKRVSQITKGGQSTTYDYNSRGLLSRAQNDTGVVTLTYDSAGRVETETVNGETISYTYNDDGQRLSFTALGQTVSYVRDIRGLIQSISAPEGDYSLAYDALARRNLLSMPNGEQTSYSYNVAGQPQNIEHSGPYDETLNYQYDARGLLTGFAGSDFAWSYDYDADGQLISASSAQQSVALDYDGAGNPIGQGQIYNSANQLLEDVQYIYTYDDRGNLVVKQDKDSGARTEYAWDGWNRLSGIDYFADATATAPDTTKSFSYGPLGRRWSRTVNGATERFVYDGFDRIAALDASGNLIDRVTFGTGVDEPLSIQGDGGSRYLHADHVGSIIGVSSASATLGEYRYSPFGETLSQPDGLDNPFMYAARESEGEGLYYNRARYYDAVAKRFISEDPMGVFPGNTNLYTYAQNNPVHGVDPDGRIVWFAVPALYFAVEVGLSIYDAYDTVSTLTDPCASAGQKWAAGGLWALGVVAPGGGYTAADDIAEGIGKQVAKQGDDVGVIYRVDGDKTPSGKPYIGSSDNLDNRARNARDGRDRSGAEIVDTYPKGDRDARRAAEQRAINENGGVPNLDNKRNEIAPSKWSDFGID